MIFCSIVKLLAVTLTAKLLLPSLALAWAAHHTHTATAALNPAFSTQISRKLCILPLFLGGASFWGADSLLVE